MLRTRLRAGLWHIGPCRCTSVKSEENVVHRQKTAFPSRRSHAPGLDLQPGHLAGCGKRRRVLRRSGAGAGGRRRGLQLQRERLFPHQPRHTDAGVLLESDPECGQGHRLVHPQPQRPGFAG